MKACNINIMLVQECGRTSKVEITQAVGKIMGYSCLVNVNEQEIKKGKNGKKQKGCKGEGMMIQMSQGMKARTPEHYRDTKGRLQCALITGKKKPGQQQAVLAVANVYMPVQNNGNWEKYKDEVEEMVGMIGEWIEETKQKGYNVLIMGDLNVALSETDRSSGKLSRLDKWVGPKIEAWGLIDVWRCKHPKIAGHTWHGTYEDRKISSRIDYALCDADLLSFITGIRPQYAHNRHSRRILGTRQGWNRMEGG
jgi:exonuclease III